MMSSYQIHITDTAREHIKTMLKKADGIGFRLSVKKTGCSGYSYAPSVIKTVQTTDIKLDDVIDFSFYIDTQYSALLAQLTIDLIEEDQTGLKQKKLVFTNPKEAGRCGCGTSFHMSEDSSSA